MALQWLSLVGAIWLQSIAGTNTNFPAYSSQLKELISLSQLQLNNLAFASDAGKLLGLFSGIAALYLPLWLVLLIGSTLGFIGYGIQYLFLLTNSFSSLPYACVLLLTVLAGNGICWINTVCYIIAIENFPFDRQVAVGLSTSYQGLSAKIYANIVDAFFSPSSPPSSSLSQTLIDHDRAKSYLMLNSILPLICCFIASPLLRVIKNTRRSRKLSGGFVAMFAITLLTGIYAVITSMQESTTTRSSFSPLMILTGMAVFLMIPLAVPIVEKIRETMEQKCSIRRDRVHACTDEGGGSIEEGVVEGDGMARVKEVVFEQIDHDVKEEIGVRVMVKRVDFWLYFFVYLFGATLGMVYLNNLGQIAESRGNPNDASLVALASSFGFFGRLLPILLDYYVSRTRYKMSRPASMAMMMVSMTGAFFLLLNNTSLSLNISTGIIGLSTGAITSISVSTTTELFGTKNFGVNHNILVTNIPIGSFLFGDLAALLYRRNMNPGEGKCIGVKCFETSFIIWGSLCLLGTFLSLILHTRTKDFYSRKT